MKHKVQRISADLSERLSRWEQVDSITLLESEEEDLISPYFFISLDVYYRNGIPPAEARQQLFSDTGAFESSGFGMKDRFFIEDIPVRIEFKNIDRINHILDLNQETFWSFRATGTYMFYRLIKGKVLIQKTPWLDGIKNRLQSLPENFWNMLALSCQSTMEHYLIDMKSAVIEQDMLFYMISISGFLKSMASLLFAVNREFEPSRRKLAARLYKLGILPAHFKSHFSSLLSEGDDMTPDRKTEIAEMLAKGAALLIGNN